MGPREILGLIEEASGTRMYEEKKEKALRTISKKEKKVEDIASVSTTPPLCSLIAHANTCVALGRRNQP
jgi:hypothetical protein